MKTEYKLRSRSSTAQNQPSIPHIHFSIHNNADIHRLRPFSASNEQHVTWKRIIPEMSKKRHHHSFMSGISRAGVKNAPPAKREADFAFISKEKPYIMPASRVCIIYSFWREKIVNVAECWTCGSPWSSFGALWIFSLPNLRVRWRFFCIVNYDIHCYIMVKICFSEYHVVSAIHKSLFRWSN